MSVERVFSIGERLQKLLDVAEKEAVANVVEAEQKARNMISKVKADVERRRAMAQRGYGIDELLKKAEEKATKEAEKKLKDYKKQAEAIKDVSEKNVKEALHWYQEAAKQGDRQAMTRSRQLSTNIADMSEKPTSPAP